MTVIISPFEYSWRELLKQGKFHHYLCILKYTLNDFADILEYGVVVSELLHIIVPSYATRAAGDARGQQITRGSATARDRLIPFGRKVAML